MKKNILDEFNTNSQLTTLNNQDLTLIDKNLIEFNHRIVELEGWFINEKNILLDNQVYNGKVGYFVFTPLKTNQGHIILINRGWIPLEKSRKILPTIEPIHEMVKIKGQLKLPTKNRFIKEEAINNNIFPLVTQQINIEQLQIQLSRKILGGFINIDADSLFGFEVPPAKSQWLSPEKHYAYSLQWILLAACLLITYYLANKNTYYKKQGLKNDN